MLRGGVGARVVGEVRPQEWDVPFHSTDPYHPDLFVKVIRR